MGAKRFLIVCILAVGMTFSASLKAQGVYSQNIVGYVNLVLQTGDNLIANQLVSTSDTLSNLFQSQIPDGSTFTKWDSLQDQFLPVSTYHSGSGWDINYALTLGEGGMFHSLTPFTNTFTGYVWPGINLNSALPDFGQPVISSYGILLLSCLVPVNNADFYEVVGRNPQNGESVTELNPVTQLYSTTTFLNGSWNNGAPLLNLGQSAFFNLQSVPEPSFLGMLGIGATLTLVASKVKKLRNN